MGVIARHPEIALKGVKLRAYGQEIIRRLTGKRIHGVIAIPGGVNRALAAGDREVLLGDHPQILTWAREAVALARDLYLGDRALADRFASFPSNYMSLIRSDGALDLYDGGLRARDARGEGILDHVDYAHYNRYLHEEVKSWSYMKFPFLLSRGHEEGWYRVGPLARMNNVDFIPTPLAEAERVEFMKLGSGLPVPGSLAYHWARMIELLHAAEGIGQLLDDPDLLGDDLRVQGERALEGVGLIEAPRGTLFHHYRINEDDQITHCNLIVSTTNNNTAMNTAVRHVADQYFDGRALTEGLLNRIEVAIRAYDPCLSCATHALGRMPLQVELLDADGALVDRLARGGDGVVERSR